MIAEKLLHFIWQFRLFNQLELYSLDDEKIKILHIGEHNKDAGPDFLHAKIVIDDTLWVGHVEMHVEGKDWVKHKHHEDEKYNNVVLHVVFCNPVDVLRADGTKIVTLQLQHYLSASVIDTYVSIFENKNWIPCESQLSSVEDIHKYDLLDKMVVNRLEEQFYRVRELFYTVKGDWEHVLFIQLCRSFGTKVNADVFLRLAELINITLLRKYFGNRIKLEAMFFGQAGFLANDLDNDLYIEKLINEYHSLKHLHKLREIRFSEWSFMRMRPPNFPTFRLAQFVSFYTKNPYLFQRVISCKTLDQVLELLKIDNINNFWYNHFRLDKQSTIHSVVFSKAFKDHVVINAFIPIIFTYGKMIKDVELQERAYSWLQGLNAEDNNIVRKFSQLGLLARNASDSQAVLWLKKNYCNQKKCLSCCVGLSLFKP
ncbi:DUF2851 family protein [Sphingobacterium sp. LRF_L2]|uniref:DUF2851 family protein n=1 Tax=Sphingobacterium sp. LRF_L2 TaxID=3369421 RepID=UPI003F647F0C